MSLRPVQKNLPTPRRQRATRWIDINRCGLAALEVIAVETGIALAGAVATRGLLALLEGVIVTVLAAARHLNAPGQRLQRRLGLLIDNGERAEADGNRQHRFHGKPPTPCPSPSEQSARATFARQFWTRSAN